MRLLKGRSVESDNIEIKNPSVFSIQHFCLQDGPGIRSIIFFKGCPLRCSWCQNPESWRKKPELAFKAHLCIGCETCVQSCPHSAILSPGNRNKSICELCFTCVETCPSSALIRFGQDSSVDDIMEELRPEYAFYRNSSGGVTFSGGEPTLFPDFATMLSLSLKKDNIHLAMETCGMFQLNWDKPHSKIWDLLSLLDLVIFDIKLFDNDTHRKYCGSGNKLIKQNLKHLSKLKQKGLGPDIWPRLPVIPGVTDTTDNLSGWASFLLENNFTAITLVPYHNMGEAKRPWIGLQPGPEIPSLTDEALSSVREFFTQKNISCFNPGEEAG